MGEPKTATELDAQVLAAWKVRGPGEPALMRIKLDPGIQAVTVLGQVGDWVVHETIAEDGHTGHWVYTLSHGPTGRGGSGEDSVEDLMMLARAYDDALPAFERWEDAPKDPGMLITEAWRNRG